jgi:hypothetical protein
MAGKKASPQPGQNEKTQQSNLYRFIPEKFPDPTRQRKGTQANPKEKGQNFITEDSSVF